MIDIDKINIAMLKGLSNKNIQSYNNFGWDKIAEISRAHQPNTRLETFQLIIDDMYNNAINKKLGIDYIKNVIENSRGLNNG